MSSFTTYQVALVVVLVLNLVFWFLLLLFRLFCNCSSHGVTVRRSTDRRLRFNGQRRLRHPPRSRRRSSGGRSNDAFTPDDQEDVPPYSIEWRSDIPPTYEEATKYIIIPTDGSPRLPPHYVRVDTSSRTAMTYERPVTLMVPEEPTSTSETRLQTSLSETNVHGQRNANMGPTIPQEEHRQTLVQPSRPLDPSLMTPLVNNDTIRTWDSFTNPDDHLTLVINPDSVSIHSNPAPRILDATNTPADVGKVNKDKA